MAENRQTDQRPPSDDRPSPRDDRPVQGDGNLNERRADVQDTIKPPDPPSDDDGQR